LNLSLRTGWLNCGSGLRRLPMHGGRAEGHLLLDRRLGDVSRQRCMRTEVRQGNANQKEEAHCYCADEHALQSGRFVARSPGSLSGDCEGNRLLGELRFGLSWLL